MSVQPTGPGVPIRRTTTLPFLVRPCIKRWHAVFSSLLGYALFCLFFPKWPENIFSSCAPETCRGDGSATVFEKGTRRSTPVAADACYPSCISFANAKLVFPPVLARDPPATMPAQQKGSTEAYVHGAARSPAQGHGHEGESNNNIGTNLPVHPAVLEFAQLNGAVGDNAGEPASAGMLSPHEEKAEKLRRIIALLAGKNSGRKGTDGTHSSDAEGDEGEGEHTQSGIFGSNIFVNQETHDELKAARIQRIISAHQKQTTGGLINKYEELDTVPLAESMYAAESSSIQSGINREDAVAQEDSRGREGTSDIMGMIRRGNEQKTLQELSQKQMEKIRREIKFTQKFDFDKAWDEALQHSKTRLIWNITYTDEHLMAQKLHEKMEAFVLRKYIALLKQDRELFKIPVVGNPQLMHFLRNLLKREHIKTTKTDAEIGRLFRKVPRLFDWIPLAVDEEQGSENTTRQHYPVDEL